jgi:type IV pilus assembly protein PilV
MMVMRRARSLRRNARGYTAVEVLSALMLLAVGAAGVIGMQKVTIQGGADARHFDIATNIAHEWLGRLQRDAMYWTQPNANTPTSNLGTSPPIQWVSACAGKPATAPCTGTSASQYYVLPPIAAAGFQGLSLAFDIGGREVGSGTGDHYYCVQYRLSWIADPANAACAGTGNDTCTTALMRAEVRVFWERLEYGIIKNCAALPVAMNVASSVFPNTTSTYHFVYAATAIRENAGDK